MLKLVYPSCKKFFGLLLTPLYHTLLHIAIWMYSLWDCH
jgi:hypothetical protein